MKEKLITISIIVPVYNSEKYLCKCVDSILNQNYKYFELILVDDGSTDNSYTICNNYSSKDRRVKTFHQENSGQSVARNYGISQATGDYIMFVDSDDYLCEDNAFKMIANLLKDDTDIIVYGHKHNVQMNKIITRNLNRFLTLPQNINNGEMFLYEMVGKDNYYAWMPWLYVIRMEYWKENRFQFKEGVCYEDLRLIWKVLASADTLAVLREVIYVYRVNQSSSTTKTFSNYVCKCHLEALKNNALEINELDYSNNLKTVIMKTFATDYYYFLTSLQDKVIREDPEIDFILKETYMLLRDTPVIPKHYFIKVIVDTFGFGRGMKIIRFFQNIKNILSIKK